MNMNKDERVCITGVTGYLGSWILKTFVDSFECNYKLRCTVRDIEDNDKIKPLEKILGEKFDDIEFVRLDLNDPESISAAIDGCDYVVHTASPYPDRNPKTDTECETEVINPALEGTKAVLEACKKYKVQKLVFTSSIDAVVDYDKFETDKTYDESDWLEINDKTLAYPKSKTLAEMEIKSFYEGLSDRDKFDIIVFNPGFMIGQILIKKEFTSQNIICKVMMGKYPGLPRVYKALVDVRDVAEAHVKAVYKKTPVGLNRYILVQDVCEFVEVGKSLTDEFGRFNYEPSNQRLGYCTAKVAAWFIPEAKTLINQWGKKIKISNKKAKEEFDLMFISYRGSLKDMGYSMMEQGYIEDYRKRDESP